MAVVLAFRFDTLHQSCALHAPPSHMVSVLSSSQPACDFILQWHQCFLHFSWHGSLLDGRSSGLSVWVPPGSFLHTVTF